MTVFTQLLRRIRFGPPIIVVSGLPRSGTSMMMQMLTAGGLQPLTDGVRTADESNPEGYFELEAVKELDKTAFARGDGLAWLANARGKAVKILTPLLQYLPETFNYRVILMQRPLDEVVTSQNTMLARAGEATDVVPASRVILFRDPDRPVWRRDRRSARPGRARQPVRGRRARGRSHGGRGPRQPLSQPDASILNG
jgi:hypothetical protein